MTQQYQSNSFITSLQKHELDSFSSLYDQYSTAFYAYLKRTLYKKEICEQGLVDAFCTIWNTIHEFDPQKERLHAWAMNIVQKEARRKKIDLVLQEIFACQQVKPEKDQVSLTSTA